ncbi:MAG: AAA family ATPase [Anaerohalosphaeraceae bacterium]
MVKNADQYARNPAGSGWTGKKPATESSLPTIRLSDVQAKSVSWLYPNRYPNRAINLIAGQGATGKTTYSAHLMSCITTGKDFHDAANEFPPRQCLYFGEEDDLDTVLRPKLDAAGADVSRVVAFDYERFFASQGHGFNLAEHIKHLEKTIEEMKDCGAVFIDPLNGYLGAINSYSDNEARSVLIPLQNLAKKYNIAIFGLCHLSKKSDAAAIDRVLGSVAFVNAARSVHLITTDKETGLRFLTIEKANYSVDPTNLSFRIVDGAVAFADGITTKTADDILQAGRQKSDTTSQAVCWLRDKLKGGGVLSNDIRDQASHEGYSRYALEAAKLELKVVAKRDSFGGKWRLYLPGYAADTIEGVGV